MRRPDRSWRWPGAASTPPSATSPAAYAALEAGYLAGLAGVVALARRRERDGSGAVPLRELPVLAMATFGLADVLAREKISTWLREPFVLEGSDHKPVEPEGTGMRRAVGELITCPRCVGTWSALLLVALRTGSPAAGRATANVLALGAVNVVLQGGFRLLTEHTNQAIARTAEMQLAADS